MSSTGTRTETIALCAECGYQQIVSIAGNGRVRVCQNCACDLRFKREVTCPHCRKGVSWSADLIECPLCKGGFAPSIPLTPDPSRSLSRVLTGALDVVKAKQWEYLATDVRRRSEALYRAWAARSRNDGAMVEEAVPATVVRRVGPRPVRAWYVHRAAEAGLAAALVLVVWGGAAVWRSVTREAIQGRLSELSTAALRADGQAAGSFYGRTLVRFQNEYDVPHEKAARAVAQVFRDYPFVIHYAYSNPVFESVWPGEVSLLVDREWELRGNHIYSGSERHRLIWKREDGEWRIVSQELIRTNWSRKTTPGVDAAGGATAIGVQ